MKRIDSVHPLRPLILLGTLTALVTTVACTSKPLPVSAKSQPAAVNVRPEAPKSVAFTAARPAPLLVAEKESAPVKQLPAKPVLYKSRDYGVSLIYPWQYTRLGAKAIADDSSLQPQSDGYESQVTLVRIEVPQGFYPDTDFDNGYFTLSLNPDISEDECPSTLKLAKDGKPQVASINGVDFKWTETDSGGRGASAKVRNYVAYANDTCYELEMGVKTKNDGLAREIEPDQVLRRLDAILTTVKIGPDTKSPAKQQLQSSTGVPASDPGK